MNEIKNDGGWYDIDEIMPYVKIGMESNQKVYDTAHFIWDNSVCSKGSNENKFWLSDQICNVYKIPYRMYSWYTNESHHELKKIHDAIKSTAELTNTDKVFLTFDSFNLITKSHNSADELSSICEDALTMFKQSDHYMPNYNQLSWWQKLKF